MKTSFISTFGALAVAGLSMSLIPSAQADIVRVAHEHHLKRLPVGARVVSVRGERCWVAGGAYYRISPRGGFILFQPTLETAVVEQPVVETVEVQTPVVKTVVEQPVVEEAATTVTEEPVVEEESDDDAIVETVPADSTIVVINGERCWLHDGVYYRHSDHGFQKFHPYGRHDSHHQALNHGGKDRYPHTTVNHGDHTKHASHEASAHNKHDKRN